MTFNFVNLILTFKLMLETNNKNDSFIWKIMKIIKIKDLSEWWIYNHFLKIMFDQKSIFALLKLNFYQILFWFNVLMINWMINWMIIEWLNQCFKC
jgi:hypothetical protein